MGTIDVPYSKMDALRSAGFMGLSLFESLLCEADLHQIFCSEWVAAAHAYVGIWPTNNSGRWNPNHLMRYLRSRGILFNATETEMKTIATLLTLLISVSAAADRQVPTS